MLDKNSGRGRILYMVQQLQKFQTTIGGRASLTGIGAHSGKKASISVLPADSNTGVVFSRVDRDFDGADVGATYNSVCATELCTVLGEVSNPAVATVEHLMAALYGMGIDNATVEIDGPEVPILDGSSAEYVEVFNQLGKRKLSAPRRYIKVVKPVSVRNGKQYGEIVPHSSFGLDITIDFDCDLIGRQQFISDITPKVFANELSRARTFGFMSDVKMLWSAGKALGSSLDNAVVLGDDKILNPEGLRFKDEFVRHKALDAVGDLSLAGAPILGLYRSVRGGHKLNHEVLMTLMEDRSAWRWVSVPARRNVKQPEVAGGVIAAAFGPNVT